MWHFKAHIFPGADSLLESGLISPWGFISRDLGLPSKAVSQRTRTVSRIVLFKAPRRIHLYTAVTLSPSQVPGNGWCDQRLKINTGQENGNSSSAEIEADSLKCPQRGRLTVERGEKIK